MMATNFEKIEDQLREDSPSKSPTKERYQVVEEKQNVVLDWSEFDLQYPSLYHTTLDPQNTTIKNEVKGADGKIQRIYLNNKKEVIFSNKVRRETFPDGYTIVYFNNGDIK